MAGVGTVSKSLEVLDRLAEFGRPARFAELLDRCDFPKATLYRLLQMLDHQGMIAYEPETRSYRLGMRLVRLAHAAWRQSSLAPIARPYLDALSNEIGQTLHLAQLDGGQVLYVDKRNASERVDMFSDAGKVGPAYCTGVGKAMLAYVAASELEMALSRQSFHRFTPSTITSPDALTKELEAVRRAGLAFDREEHEPGIVCIAAPLLSTAGKVLGAMSITTHTARIGLNELPIFAPKLLSTAQEIAREAELWLFPQVAAGGAQDAAAEQE